MEFMRTSRGGFQKKERSAKLHERYPYMPGLNTRCKYDYLGEIIRLEKECVTLLLLHE